MWKKKKREVFWNKLCALVTQIQNNVDTQTPRSSRDDEKKVAFILLFCARL